MVRISRDSPFSDFMGQSDKASPYYVFITGGSWQRAQHSQYFGGKVFWVLSPMADQSGQNHQRESEAR